MTRPPLVSEAPPSRLVRFNLVDWREISRARIGIGILAALALIGSLLAANWVTTDYGFIPVGFGFESTAGTLFAGVMLASRDAVQDALGRLFVLGLILLGTVVSFAVAAPAIAIASAVAFLTAETLDFAIYTPIRARAKFGNRRWAVAVVASNIVGAITDTVVFLGIAFGLAAIGPALPGQIVGKMWATVAYLLIGAVLAHLYRRYRSKRQDAERDRLAETYADEAGWVR